MSEEEPMAPITIRDVKTIMTQPAGSRLVVLKVLTSEPELYGLGCATFTQRYRAVHTAVEEYLKPLVIGRDVSQIEDIWRGSMVNAYWRNGPVLNNALSGLDIALWDIKGKMAKMPVYQLLGGKSRNAAAAYTHADGANVDEVAESVGAFIDQGYRYVRVQLGGYGGARLQALAGAGGDLPVGVPIDRKSYMRNTVRVIEHVREAHGDDVELLHDVHERLHPVEVVQLAKELEAFKLFFLEDPLAPEDLSWFENIRQQCATPIAMGELFNNPREWQPLVEGRLIDFVRMHISQMGGITPARNVAILADHFGVRTAWHGPGDVSPVGHAANLHLDLWAPNFGVQEWCRFPEIVYEVFPGTPVIKDGFLYGNDQPGLGIDIDEKLAARYPCDDSVVEWTKTRLSDGTQIRP